ncbi:sugar transferase [Gloeobacter kilaueensis]|uniref:Exopolysaccharide biosynthesis polyprenyl glycosylphosphotransferase n=1 Tax=Gloeobacter kilaueensis (strain ATCC BAA-2537 / CCAP 1431/1 / ULC 316 / JS1) TaxID=1183438 RepID=U5QKL6_GLOK1|nr:sugar transferase [Gloeobacter kilaueensis]AGY59398.1 exopolysaccharide biosynthesis polyprenyl glycosylphosphotransferase [Gloeobacter kilaueensis JS1]
MSSSSASFVDVRAGLGLRVRRTTLMKWSRLVLLVISDYLAFLSAWSLAGQWNALKIEPGYLNFKGVPIWLIAGFMVAVIALRGLYRGGSYWRSYRDLLIAISLSVLLLHLGWFVLTGLVLPIGRSVLVAAWFLSMILAGLGREIVKRIIFYLRRRHYFCIPTFIVALGDRQAQIERQLATVGYRVVGYAAPSADNLSSLLERVIASEAQEVAVSTIDYLPGLPAFYRGLRSAGITVRWVPDRGELLLRQIGTPRILGGLPTVEVSPPLISGMDFRLKRLVDILLAGTALLVLSPLFLAIALAIRLNSAGPVFFVQQRVGVRGRPFRIYKFRSMYVDAEQRKAELMAQNEVQGPLFKLRNDPRVTAVGAFLRRTSLDELPQLINVLIGEMSLVGPRPPVPAEVEQYEKWHYDRLLVLPGITGLWQISGRSDLKDFDDVVRLDLYYIQNWSLALDLEILFKTVGVVLRAQGAY